jgi:DNA-binding MurR/RpiR family transcriptional regulator
MQSMETTAGAAGRAASDATPYARLLALLDEHRLTPTQRRIAQCLLENAAEAPFLSSTRLAELANVSQPSVTRFAVALGFDGYPDLRNELRTLLTDGGVEAESSEDMRRNAMQHAVAQDIANLGALAETLADPAPVQAAGRLLAGSRPLTVLGLRASAAIAGHFAYFARKTHPDVRLIDGGGTYLGDRLEQARAAGGTALVAFLMPRWPRETLDAIRTASDLGLRVVTVTDRAMTPAREFSEHVLVAGVGTHLVFDSHAAPMALAMVLLQAMCDATPACDVQERLEQFEQSAAERRIFVP